MKKVISILSAAAVALGLTVAVTPSAFAACGGKLKIAYQGPLTGDYAAIGLNELRGVQFAVKKSGLDIEVKEVDDQGNPAVAGPIAPSVAQDDCIIGLVGPAFSGASKVSLPIYKSAGLPIITPSATNPDLFSMGGDIFHRAVLTDDFQGPALARLVMSKVKNASVFLIDDASDYSVGLAKLVNYTLGSRVVGKDTTPQGTTDFASTIAMIKKSKANAVIYTGYFAEAATLVKQLRDSGSKATFAAGDGVVDAQFIKLARKAAEGALLTAPAVPFDAASPKLAAEFKKVMGTEPGIYSTESYDAANFFLAAIAKGNKDRASVLNYINKNSFKGLSKTLRFDNKGEVAGVDVNGFTVKNGKIVLSGPIR